MLLSHVAFDTVCDSSLLGLAQELRLTAGPKVQESIAKINAAFPAEAVKFSDPSYARELISKLDEE